MRGAIEHACTKVPPMRSRVLGLMGLGLLLFACNSPAPETPRETLPEPVIKELENLAPEVLQANRTLALASFDGGKTVTIGRSPVARKLLSLGLAREVGNREALKFFLAQRGATLSQFTTLAIQEALNTETGLIYVQAKKLSGLGPRVEGKNLQARARLNTSALKDFSVLDIDGKLFTSSSSALHGS
jgi:hypothetical protein